MERGSLHDSRASTTRPAERYRVVETRLTLRPGAPGTKRLAKRYGERLVRVRYLYDEARGLRLKTVELVVEETAWKGRARRPLRDDHDLVRVRIDWRDTELRAAIKKARAVWRPTQKMLRYTGGCLHIPIHGFTMRGLQTIGS